MIKKCHLCHEWYRGKCVKAARDILKEDDLYTCPTCVYRLKMPRNASQPTKLEDLQIWQDELDNLPSPPNEDEALGSIIDNAQTDRDYTKPIIQSDVPTTPEEVDTTGVLDNVSPQCNSYSPSTGKGKDSDKVAEESGTIAKVRARNVEDCLPPTVDSRPPKDGFNSEEGHGSGMIGPLLVRAHERDLTLCAPPPKETVSMYEVLHKKFDMTTLYTKTYTPLSYLKDPKYAYLSQAPTANDNGEDGDEMEIVAERVVDSHNSLVGDNEETQSGNAKHVSKGFEAKTAHNSTFGNNASLNPHIYQDGIGPIPQNIQDVIQTIKGCKKNVRNLPRRSYLHKALPEHFTFNRGFIKQASPLLGYYGDSRLFTIDEWYYPRYM